MKISQLLENQNDEIRNYEKLDKILYELCKLVVEGQKEDPKKFGMVAAGLLDLDNNLVARTSTFVGKWRHAEKNAIEDYIKQYGKIPDGSIIITTCSPCSEIMHDRFGSSCTVLLDAYKIKKVYTGYIDPTQEEEHRDFNIMETENESIRDLCKEFAEVFLDNEVEQSK